MAMFNWVFVVLLLITTFKSTECMNSSTTTTSFDTSTTIPSTSFYSSFGKRSQNNNHSGPHTDCFRRDSFYFYGTSDTRFCERYLFDNELLSCISAFFIIFIGFYHSFFTDHDLALLRFISISFMYNGIAAYLNHYHGKREWLFMDNISLIISVYLLLSLCVIKFLENSELVALSSLDGSTVTAKFQRTRTFSFSSNSPKRESSVPVTTTAEDVLNERFLLIMPRLKFFGWILVCVMIWFLCFYNLNGCGWTDENQEQTFFVVFVLVIPLIVFAVVIAFYMKFRRQNHKEIGTFVNSSTVAWNAFKIYIRGVIVLFLGNLFWIITEMLCSESNNGIKALPGHLLYNVLSFYGYSLIMTYVAYLWNDLQKIQCDFRKSVAVWDWVFPCIVTMDKENKDVVEM